MSVPGIGELRDRFGGLLLEYQLECAAAADDFAEAAARVGAQAAFNERVPGWPYRPAREMPETPYVCLKVPTGGGKTLIAAASVGPLSRQLRTASGRLGTDAPAVLWFAPTGAIVEQTLRALRDPDNRCRRALDLWFPDRPVNAIPLKEAYLLSPSDWRSRANIVVSTIQSARIGDTEGRKVYESAGLIQHFRGLPESVLAELRKEDGRVVCSLENVFRVLRPLVIVDEADEACSELSFRSLARFSPSWILEITATPRERAGGGLVASNVLRQVSANRLRDEHMIKLPLVIRAVDDWRAAVRMAAEKRSALEQAAAGTGIRPVALYQAEAASSRRGTVTAEELQRTLVGDLGIPEPQVALATGGRELDGEAGTEASPVRHVVTVRQLARGWDCPAAYVLCGVANIGAQGAVEQLLGRVLRMPGARQRSGELSAAYVFAARTNFAQAAGAVAEMLEKCHGFKPSEAKRAAADADGLYDAGGGDGIPAGTATPLRIPRLVIRMRGGTELFEQSHFFLGEPWEAAHLNSALPNFSPEVAATAGEVDVSRTGRVVRRTEEATAARTALFESDRQWRTPDLMAWLSRRIPHDDIPSAQMLPFIRRALEGVKSAHNMDDAELTANRFRLEREIARRLRQHRATRRARGFQQSLGGMLAGMRLATDAKTTLEISERNYRPRELCENIEFQNHLFPNKVGKLDNEEEENCAVHIDAMPETEVWLRNLAGDDLHSFWLPTSSDLFYPDFVVRLKDGRILVVEYKGDRWEEAQEDRDIGDAWARLSGGQCVFVMVAQNRGSGLNAINNAVAQKPPAKKRQ